MSPCYLVAYVIFYFFKWSPDRKLKFGSEFRTGPHYLLSKCIKCPECDEDRYKEGTNVAVRKFTYFPLAPRIERMIASENIVQILTKHCHDGPPPDKKSDIQDTPLWKTWFPEQSDPENKAIRIALNFNTDGVNPYKSNKEKK